MVISAVAVVLFITIAFPIKIIEVLIEPRHKVPAGFRPEDITIF
jgi:hypothetical protein